MIVGNDDLFILVAKEPSGRYSPYDQQDRTIVYKFIQIIFKYKTRLFGACSGHGLAKKIKCLEKFYMIASHNKSRLWMI